MASGFEIDIGAVSSGVHSDADKRDLGCLGSGDLRNVVRKSGGDRAELIKRGEAPLHIQAKAVVAKINLAAAPFTDDGKGAAKGQCGR